MNRYGLSAIVLLVLSVCADPVMAETVAAVDLPSFSDTGTVPLRSIPAADQAGLELEIANAKVSSGNLGRIYVVKPDAAPGHWQIQLSTQPNPTPIAMLRLQGDTLQFSWQPEINRAQAAGLRNSLLLLRLGEQVNALALRKPVRIAATPLDLRKPLTTINVEVDDLPDVDFLSFDPGRLTGYAGSAAVSPKEHRFTLKQPVTFTLKDADADSPGVALEVLLVKNGSKLNVTARPVAISGDGNVLPFTLKSVKDAQALLKNQISAAQKTIAGNERSIGQLQTKLLRMNGTVLRNAQDRINFEQDVVLTQNQIKQMQLQNTELKKGIPVLQKQLDAMPDLQKIADNLHLHAAPDFRVYYQIGNREIELFEAEPTSARR